MWPSNDDNIVNDNINNNIINHLLNDIGNANLGQTDLSEREKGSTPTE